MNDDNAIAPAVVNAEVVGFDYETVNVEHRSVIELRTAAIKERVRRATQDIVEIGEMLADVKERLPHGQFTLWLQIEFSWDVTTARRFMSVATMFKTGSGSRFSSTALLERVSIDQSGLFILASKTTPKEIRQDILERAYQGEPFTKKKVKQIVDSSKKQGRATPKSRTPQKPQPPLAVGHWVRVQTFGGNKVWDGQYGRVVASSEFSKYGVRLNNGDGECLRFYLEELIPIPYLPGQLVTMSFPKRSGKEYTQYNGCWGVVTGLGESGSIQVAIAGKKMNVLKADTDPIDNPPTELLQVAQKVNALLERDDLDEFDRGTLKMYLRKQFFTSAQQRRLDHIYNDYFSS